MLKFDISNRCGLFRLFHFAIPHLGAPMAGDAVKGDAMFTLRLLWNALFSRHPVVPPEAQYPFGPQFQNKVGLSLWPSWGVLQGVRVEKPDGGELSVSVERDTEWVPLSLTSELPGVAKDSLKQLAKAGAEGHPIPSWAEGDQKGWLTFYEKLASL